MACLSRQDDNLAVEDKLLWFNLAQVFDHRGKSLRQVVLVAGDE
jgi:hypothetical protein